MNNEYANLILSTFNISESINILQNFFFSYSFARVSLSLSWPGTQCQDDLEFPVLLLHLASARTANRNTTSNWQKEFCMWTVPYTHGAWMTSSPSCALTILQCLTSTLLKMVVHSMYKQHSSLDSWQTMY